MYGGSWILRNEILSHLTEPKAERHLESMIKENHKKLMMIWGPAKGLETVAGPTTSFFPLDKFCMPTTWKQF